MGDKIFDLKGLIIYELDKHYLEVSYSDFRDSSVFKAFTDEDFLYTFQLLVTTNQVSFPRFGSEKTRYPEEVKKIKRVLNQYNPQNHVIGNYSNTRFYEIDDGKELYIFSGKRSRMLRRMKLEILLKG